MKVLDIVSTPNPNAVKVLLDSPVAPITRSFFNAAAARDDQLAASLFAIPDVAGIMLLGSFITISKRKDAPWAPIIAQAKRVLEGGAEG